MVRVEAETNLHHLRIACSYQAETIVAGMVMTCVIVTCMIMMSGIIMMMLGRF